MAKYTVVISTLWVDGVKHKRGDIIETDQDYGTNVELYVEPAETEKPKRKRRTKAEMLIDVPKFGGEDLA